MFPEGTSFIQDINEVIEIFIEESSNEVLRRDENIRKRQNAGAGIDRLVISFGGKTYKSGKKLCIIEQELKEETDSFIKV